jgi:DNA-binding beta-propeller fold protein YncE
MKTFGTALGVSLIVAFLALSLVPAAAAGQGRVPGRIVVANRGAGSLSVIDAHTDALIDTFDLPMQPGDATPEPMYVVYSAARDRVFVGDRANDRVVVYNARDLSLEALVPAGAGVYHMWADPQSRFAYVTVLGLPGDQDYVVQFSTETFEEVGRAAVGKDPHLGLFRQTPHLYVAAQNSDLISVLDRETLELVSEIHVPGAHGAGMPRNGRYFYTTNLPGGGADALYTIDTHMNMVVGAPVSTPYSVPHNIVLTPNSQKLYVTHSGPNAVVTIYTTDGNNPVPVYAGEVTTQLNPFGLTYVP